MNTWQNFKVINPDTYSTSKLDHAIAVVSWTVLGAAIGMITIPWFYLRFFNPVIEADTVAETNLAMAGFVDQIVMFSALTGGVIGFIIGLTLFISLIQESGQKA